MVLAYLIVGVVAGSIAFLVALWFGATFWMSVTVYSLVGMTGVLLGAARILAGGAAPSRRSDTGLRILAVDDDPFIRELLPKIAARVGYADIAVAASAADALTAIATAPAPFDVLLLDINMPDISGIDLCAQVRRLPRYADAPIIMLTAMTDTNHLDRAFLAGASDYVFKPFEIIDFGNRLQAAKAQVLDRRAGAMRGGPRAGVASLIEHAALQNYLRQLSGRGLTDAYVMAFVAYGMDTSDPLSDEVARAIAAVAGGSGHLMSCPHPGVFVLVASAEHLPDHRRLQAAVQARLARATATADVTLTVGQAVRPGRKREDRARTAIDRAISLADDKHQGAAPRPVVTAP